ASVWGCVTTALEPAVVSMEVRSAAGLAFCTLAVCGACEVSCLRHHDQVNATPTRTAAGIARRAIQIEALLGTFAEPRREPPGEPAFLRLLIGNHLCFYCTIGVRRKRGKRLMLLGWA